MLPWCLLSWALTFRWLASQPSICHLYRVSKSLGFVFLFRGQHPPLGFLSSPSIPPKRKPTNRTLFRPPFWRRTRGHSADFARTVQLLFYTFFETNFSVSQSLQYWQVFTSVFHREIHIEKSFDVPFGFGTTTS